MDCKYLVNLCARPFAPEWWSVEEHQMQGFWEFNLKKISLYVLEKINDWDELRKKLAGQPVFNANLLDHLLKYPDLIPESWKKIKVFFWGTVYRFFGSDLRVRFLYWDGADWQWDFAWVGDVFNGECQMALLEL